ncbi:MAG: KpsF/GutQ family sugar-phosphate isomerase [Candidatus Scalindua sediminis]|nr:KpsF/GutQ family sugar-phosphate isomerase [Candidatus Scalindua sediminis]
MNLAMKKSSTDIEYGKKVIDMEADAVKNLIQHIDDNFEKAIDLIIKCNGRIVVTGIGKAGIIGQKISATLASTGTPSYWMHSFEARHGDLGRVVAEDVVLALSNSGETEVAQLIPFLKKIGAKTISITGNDKSRLAKYSDIVLYIGNIDEACPLGLAPTASSTAMLALGDALALTVLKKRNLSKEEYVFFHPGGEIGRKLLTVDVIMRKDEENPITNEDTIVADALKIMTSTKGRPGAVSVLDSNKKLVGFFTDGDLRRNLQKDVSFLKKAIKDVMTKKSKFIKTGRLASEAYKILRENKIDQISVVDDNNVPVGMVDVQDLLDAGY